MIFEEKYFSLEGLQLYLKRDSNIGAVDLMFLMLTLNIFHKLF